MPTIVKQSNSPKDTSIKRQFISPVDYKTDASKTYPTPITNQGVESVDIQQSNAVGKILNSESAEEEPDKPAVLVTELWR